MVSSSTVKTVDALQVSVSGAATGAKLSSLGGARSLPLRFALHIADQTASGALHLAVIGQAGGSSVGAGATEIIVVAGQRVSTVVDIETTTALDDASVEGGDGAGDLAQSPDAALGTGAPRLITPISGSVVTNPRPTVRWELAPGTVDAQLEFCGNRQFTSLAGSTTVAASGNLGTPDADLPAGVLFWRVRATTSAGPMTSQIWSFVVPKRVSAKQTVNASWGHILDVNGDGYSDIAVTASGVAVNGIQIGRIYIYAGGTAGITSATVPTTIDGLDGQLSTITGVTSAGDLDGDGYGDLIYRGGSGHAYIFTGSANGIANMAAPAAMLKNVESIAGAGDVDGDGYGDVIVGSQGIVSIYYGSAFGLAATARTMLDGSDANGGITPPAFGGVVAAAGDVNGDGFADVLIGATGKAFLYLGGKAKLTPLSLAPGVATDQTDTRAAAGIGDINNDGYPDVIVSGTTTANKTNAVFVFLGGATNASQGQVLVGPVGSGFGTSIAGIGDLDGDGHADVVIGAPFLPGTSSVPGAAYVYLSDGSSLIAQPTLTGPTADNSNFGWSAAGGGDINGDGHTDFVIGTNGNNSAWIYRGPWGGIGQSTLTGPIANSSFGNSVAQ